MTNHSPAILLYDGQCGFCTRGMAFLARRSDPSRIELVPYASERGQMYEKMYIAKHCTPANPNRPDSVLLLEKDRWSARSTATIRITKYMHFPWPIFMIFLLVPRFLRDPFYVIFARFRKRLPGAAQACPLPPR